MMATFSLPSLTPLSSFLTWRTLLALFSWRNTAIFFALINLKALPFVWHLRLIRHFLVNMSQTDRVRQKIARYKGPSHPIFEPVSMYSRTPLLETDYNFHKSNSTFLTDLDVSRTALATSLLQPGMRAGDKRLHEEGKRGKIGVILGSVHCSYHKEIKPYERYEIRSRVLGWDKKWLLIASWFIRPGEKGAEGEQILASALSKYVIKKGKFTVEPERALISSGWLPPKPTDSTPEPSKDSNRKDLYATITDSGASVVDEAAIPRRRDLSSPMQQESSTVSNGMIVSPLPERPLRQASMIKDLEDKALKGSGGSASARKRATSNSKISNISRSEKWDWFRIDRERQRGVELARGWLSLDRELLDEALQVPE